MNFCMLISSNLEKLNYNSNKLIEKNSINNLKKDSIVKTDRIYNIKDNEISYKIGNIEKTVALEYKELYIRGKMHAMWKCRWVY